MASPSSVDVMRLTPQAIPEWPLPRDRQPEHLAHAPEWASVIGRAYGHAPLYLAAEDRAGQRGLLPAFIVRRPIVGPVVTSMPFLDGGGPSGSSDLVEPLVRRLLDEAGRAGARHVELRCSHKLTIATAAPMEHKVNMVLGLPSNPDLAWQKIDRAARSQIRKAERSGLSVDVGGADYVDTFYSIFTSRMRELGSPVHAKAFFTATVDGFGDRARVALVRKGSLPIGGLIALATDNALTVPWASCLSEHLSLCPNMLLYWETIRTACRDGFGRFDFGRSTRGSGTYKFKRQWGAQEQPLFWYTIPVKPNTQPRAEAAQSPSLDGGLSTFVHLWRHLPLSLTRVMGPRVRKYLIQ
jgi:FemAB-related protein (PEP-CTERM system-associated)